jgi:hypothetical protein
MQTMYNSFVRDWNELVPYLAFPIYLIVDDTLSAVTLLAMLVVTVGAICGLLWLWHRAEKRWPLLAHVRHALFVAMLLYKMLHPKKAAVA